MSTRIVDRSFYARDPVTVARELLGKVLVSTIGGKRASGIIVETEAYLSSGDAACHSSDGMTRRNSVMFGPAGIAYVYPIHARYCFNVVTESSDFASAVLIRAMEPIEGIPAMKVRRGKDDKFALCSGPAKLCQALNLNSTSNGQDLTTRRKVWIEYSSPSTTEILRTKTTPRIGVTSAHKLELRFVIAGTAFASGPIYLR